MEDVVQQGTGTACQLDNMTVAGKTGTTDAYNDLWFVGYTPYYTCAVWSGFDNNEKLPEDARNFHKNLWKKVMTRIHEGLPDKDFEQPSSVEELSVCEETGLLPRAGCPTITEYFDIGDVPTERCGQHYYSSDYDEDEMTEYTTEEGTYNTGDTQDATEADDNADNNNRDNSDNGDGSGDNGGDSDDGNGGGDNGDNAGGDDGDGGDTGEDTGGDTGGDTGEDTGGEDAE